MPNVPKQAVSPSLRITFSAAENAIRVNALEPKRFDRFGFGTFLCEVDPPEVEITPAALGALLNCPEWNGFHALEFWQDNRLAWASSGPSLLIPVDQINVPAGAKKWIRQMTLIEEGD